MQQVIIGVAPHKLSATIEVVDEHERLPGVGPVHHRPGRVHGDAHLRQGVAAADLGGRRSERHRPTLGAAAPGIG